MGTERPDALTPAPSHGERGKTRFILRDFFFLHQGEELRIGPLRLIVAEREHGGE